MTRAFGRVAAIRGLVVDVSGPITHLAIGAQLSIALKGPNEPKLICEVVGFRDRFAICLAYGPLTGIKPGDVAEFLESEPVLYPNDAWIGRVLDGLGNPIDGKGPLPTGAFAQGLSTPPPPAHERNLVEVPLDLGIRAFNTFLPCCAGQRMGIFA
ncbi:MAG: flagellum-specific ATP synthase FliI, partial [Hyphomicrobiales bacterium]